MHTSMMFSDRLGCSEVGRDVRLAFHTHTCEMLTKRTHTTTTLKHVTRGTTRKGALYEVYEHENTSNLYLFGSCAVLGQSRSRGTYVMAHGMSSSLDTRHPSTCTYASPLLSVAVFHKRDGGWDTHGAHVFSSRMHAFAYRTERRAGHAMRRQRIPTCCSCRD